jgi:hypothetical protein
MRGGVFSKNILEGASFLKMRGGVFSKNILEGASFFLSSKLL